MNESAREFISGLLIKDPAKRLGANGAHEVKNSRFFDSIDWTAVEERTQPPPFGPAPVIKILKMVSYAIFYFIASYMQAFDHDQPDCKFSPGPELSMSWTRDPD